LIQKKTGLRLPRPTLVRVSHSSEPKAYFPAPGRVGLELVVG